MFLLCYSNDNNNNSYNILSETYYKKYKINCLMRNTNTNKQKTS